MVILATLWWWWWRKTMWIKLSEMFRFVPEMVTEIVSKFVHKTVTKIVPELSTKLSTNYFLCWWWLRQNKIASDYQVCPKIVHEIVAKIVHEIVQGIVPEIVDVDVPEIVLAICSDVMLKTIWTKLSEIDKFVPTIINKFVLKIIHKFVHEIVLCRSYLNLTNNYSSFLKMRTCILSHTYLIFGWCHRVVAGCFHRISSNLESQELVSLYF